MTNDAQNLHCSPYNHVKYGEKDGTCYSLKDLRAIAKEYNKLSPGHKIDTKLDKQTLYKQLESAFQDVCNDEFCWVQNKWTKHSNLKNKVKDSFRPTKPLEWYENKRTWLNTYDILLVMQQYEKLYKNFKFIGVYPIDFSSYNAGGQCIGDNLCTFSIKDLLNAKKTQFGMVLNLDRHNEPGSHWVAIYCNLKPKKENFGIYYYDSVANEPSSEVVDFMNMVKEQIKTLYSQKVAEQFKVKYNKVQKQFKNTECGMFSVIFLTLYLKQVPFDFICEHMRTDDEINRLRDVVYTPSNNMKPTSD